MNFKKKLKKFAKSRAGELKKGISRTTRDVGKIIADRKAESKEYRTAYKTEYKKAKIKALKSKAKRDAKAHVNPKKQKPINLDFGFSTPRRGRKKSGWDI